MDTVFFIMCEIYLFVWFYQSDGLEGNITLNHTIVMFLHALQSM